MVHSSENEFTACKSWEQAVQLSSGYEDPHLVSNLASQLRKQMPWKMDRSSDKYLDERNLQLLNALQLVAAHVGPEIRVADIGGGNGYTAYSARKQLGHFHWDWTVFESPACAAEYGIFESEAGVKWRPNLAKEYGSNYDVAILSCTLQYIEDPYSLLKTTASRSQFILIMRLPLVSDTDTDLCSVQRPRGGVYEDSQASWPSWFFSRSRFEAAIAPLGEVVLGWVTKSETVTLNGKTYPFEGLLIRTEFGQEQAITPGVWPKSHKGE